MGLVKSNGSLLPGLNVTCGLSALETRDQQRPLPFIQVYTAHNYKASDVLDLGLCTLLYFSFPEFTLGCDIVTLVILVSRAFLRPVYEDLGLSLETWHCRVKLVFVKVSLTSVDFLIILFVCHLIFLPDVLHTNGTDLVSRSFVRSG